MGVKRVYVDCTVRVEMQADDTYDPPVVTIPIDYHEVIECGTGRGQADEAFVDQRVYTASTAVDIHSRLAGIVDAGGAVINIVAPSIGAGIVLRAATGIGSADPLEIDTRLIAAANTASGDIRLADIGVNANTLVIGSAGGLAGIRPPASQQTHMQQREAIGHHARER